MTALTKPDIAFIDENLAIAAIQWRRDLHQIPELRFELYKTQQYLIDLLEKWGVEYATGYGETGIVATIKGRQPGKTIAFRCDMDALPMEDESGTPWASKHRGRSHSCGHDGHMAVTLAAIKHLTDNNDFSGCVKVLFQPNEETGRGAKAMMNDGLYEAHPYTELYGFHNMPRLKDGTLQVRYGATTGAGECFRLTIQGRSGHSSVPEKCINPISVACEIIREWHEITASIKEGMAIIATCTVDSGTSMNAIPEQASAAGTMRYFEGSIADTMRDQMHEIAQRVCDRFNASYELDFNVLCPATINTVEHTNCVIDCGKAIYGENHVIDNVPPSPGGEDMQFFVTPQVEGACWFMVGTRGTNTHTATYDFDDTSIQRMASMLASIALRRLV
ncbi:M20 metallopeptidase family protein [Endozoicomonas lisbonensis]|uniref:Amidohydrolase n=1 Tax=Endozoicomonas lisbonensis TaxID=3120522 RepID=A0ABV2SLD6_9GAMM